MGEPAADAPTAILWKRVDRPGHESARLTRAEGWWRIDGSALFTEGTLPVCLGYQVCCDGAWSTRSASVTGWMGDHEVDVQIAVSGEGEWLLNGVAEPALRGCIDVDLNFSPSTNLLPIRRLNLAVGEEARVRAAWLRFPTFRMEVLEQLYRRTAADVYEYESAGGSFKAQLRVDAAGFPLQYAVWQMEASA